MPATAFMPVSLYAVQHRFELMETSFLLSRQTVVPTAGSGMALWRVAVFAAMFRNARDTADYFQIPSNRVIELGAKLEI